MEHLRRRGYSNWNSAVWRIGIYRNKPDGDGDVRAAVRISPGDDLFRQHDKHDAADEHHFLNGLHADRRIEWLVNDEWKCCMDCDSDLSIDSIWDSDCFGFCCDKHRRDLFHAVLLYAERGL